MERAVVHGVGCSADSSGVTVTVPDRPGTAARLFRVVASAGVSIGAISQFPVGCMATVTFTVARAALAPVVAALTAAGYEPEVEPLVTVRLRGVAMRTDSAIPVIFSEALVRAGVPLRLMSMENHRLTVFCAESSAPAALRALGEAFEVPDYQAATSAVPSVMPT